MDGGDPRDTRDLRSVLAAWALVHELADEGWKAAVARGEAAPSYAADAPESGGEAAFVDAVAAQIHREKEALKARLDGTPRQPAEASDAGGSGALEALRFEVAEVRGRLESIETTLDALVARLSSDDDEA